MPRKGRKVHFVADVHLTPEDCPRNRMFMEYLRELSGKEVSRLIILGDLFHTWRHDSPVLWEAYREILRVLEAVSSRGVRIDFLPGNRDFLFGEGSERKKLHFIRFHQEPLRFRMGERTVYASHGDELCAGDYGYRLWRNFSRRKVVVSLFQRLPEWLQARLVRRLSDASRIAVARKSGNSLRIPESVYAELIRQGCDTVLHGHIHEESILDHPGMGGMVRTLSDWISKPSALVYDPNEDIFAVRSLYFNHGKDDE